MNNFLLWLRDQMFARGGHKYSRAKLARESGISPAAISGWYNEDAQPSHSAIAKLAAVFNVPQAEIYEVLGKPIPEDIDELREQIIALVYQLDPEQYARVLRELKSIYGHKRDTRSSARGD